MASFQQVTAKRREIRPMSASMRTQLVRLLAKAGHSWVPKRVDADPKQIGSGCEDPGHRRSGEQAGSASWKEINAR
jgi:hypothetical protein